jgi:hypothetical protein
MTVIDTGGVLYIASSLSLDFISASGKANSSGDPIMHQRGVEPCFAVNILQSILCTVKYTPPALLPSNLPKYEYQYQVGIFIFSVFVATTRKFGVGILPTCCLCILGLSVLRSGSCVRNTRNFKKKRTLLVGDAQRDSNPGPALYLIRTNVNLLGAHTPHHKCSWYRSFNLAT